MSRFARFTNAVIRSPLLWGVAIAVGFYSLLDALFQSGTMTQWYFLRKPLGYLGTELFFAALVSLVIKAVDGICLSREMRSSDLLQSWLGVPIPGGQPVEHAAALVARLRALSNAQQDSQLVQRLHEALRSIERRGGAESLDDELKHLSARDQRSLWPSYGWLIVAVALLPLLGFAATLLNADDVAVADHVRMAPIACALLQVSVLVVAAAAMVSFDLGLLRQVDACVTEELTSRFQRIGASNDPQVLAVRRMADAVVQVTDRLVHRQVELWQSTIQSAHQHWNHLADTTLEQTQAALETSLRKVLTEFADRLATGADASSAPPVANSEARPAALKLFSPAPNEEVHTPAPAEAEAA